MPFSVLYICDLKSSMVFKIPFEKRNPTMQSISAGSNAGIV